MISFTLQQPADVPEIRCIFANACSTRLSIEHRPCTRYITPYEYVPHNPICHRVETHTATLKAHEVRFEEIGRLAGRMKIVEEALTNISGAFFRGLLLVFVVPPIITAQCPNI